jgi:hypothetical protein
MTFLLTNMSLLRIISCALMSLSTARISGLDKAGNLAGRPQGGGNSNETEIVSR